MKLNTKRYLTGFWIIIPGHSKLRLKVSQFFDIWMNGMFYLHRTVTLHWQLGPVVMIFCLDLSPMSSSGKHCKKFENFHIYCATHTPISNLERSVRSHLDPTPTSFQLNWKSSIIANFRSYGKLVALGPYNTIMVAPNPSINYSNLVTLGID